MTYNDLLPGDTIVCGKACRMLLEHAAGERRRRSYLEVYSGELDKISVQVYTDLSVDEVRQAPGIMTVLRLEP